MRKNNIKFTEIVAPHDIISEGLSDIRGDGGCNLYRVKSKRNGISYEVCQYDDQGMQAFLEEFTLNNTKL